MGRLFIAHIYIVRQPHETKKSHATKVRPKVFTRKFKLIQVTSDMHSYARTCLEFNKTKDAMQLVPLLLTETSLLQRLTLTGNDKLAMQVLTDIFNCSQLRVRRHEAVCEVDWIFSPLANA